MFKKHWNKIKGDWRFWAWLLSALATSAIASLFWVYNVDAAMGKVAQLDMVQTAQGRKITRMDYNIQMISRAVGVQPLEPAADE